jgi:hypothetical protein
LGEGFSILLMKPPEDITYTGKRVVARPIKEDIPSVQYGVSSLQSASQTQAVRAVIQVCKEVLSNDGLQVNSFRV